MSDTVEDALVAAPQAEAEISAGETFAQADDQHDGADVLTEEEVAGALAPPAAEAPEELDEALRSEALPSPQPSAEKAVVGETIVGEGAIEQPAVTYADEHAATLDSESMNAVDETVESDAVPPGDVNLEYEQESAGRWGAAPLPILRLLEIGFGALVLILGGLTVWIRTKHI
jgi:hypothetical protein